MADLEGQWVPRTEEEFQYVETLYALTGQAYRDGVSKDDVVTGLLFVAASLTAMDPEDMDPPEGPVDRKREDCPECGEEIEDFRTEMGGQVQVLPCGCATHVTEMPGWFDDV